MGIVRTRHLLLVSCLLAAIDAASAEPKGYAKEIRLRNERPVSGPRVTLTLKYGAHYHPGAAFALEGFVRVAGEAFEGGVTVREGKGEWGPRYGQTMRFDPSAPSHFRFPIHAPAAGADLTLTVWRRGTHGAREEEFRASLAEHLHVISGQDRAVLLCGVPWTFRARAGWHIANVMPGDLPDAEWIYENIDLVILNTTATGSEGTGAEITARSAEALRNWVMAGGKVLILSTHALKIACDYRLLPLREGAGMESLGSRYEDWTEAMGLVEEDVKRDERGQLIHARFELGFGGGIFFFPGVRSVSRFKIGDKALDSAELRHARAQRTDERIWERPYDCFVSGTIAEDRRRRTALWAMVGGGCLIALLAFAAALRTRYLACSFALGFVALLSAYLAQAFRAPEGVISRVELEESTWARGISRRTEWTSLEGVKEAQKLTISSKPSSLLKPIHLHGDDLATGGTVLGSDQGMRLRFRLPSPLPIIQVSDMEETETVPAEEGMSIKLRNVGAIRLPGWLSEEMIRGHFGRWPRGAVFIDADGERYVLKEPSTQSESTPAETYESARATVKTIFEGATPIALETRARALEWALVSASRKGGVRLVLLDEATGDAAEEAAMLWIDGMRGEAGPRFRLWDIEVRSRP